MKRLLLALGLWFGLSAAALAQSAVVVSSCGTPPSTYVAGTTRYPTVDTTGNLCSLLVATSSSIVTGNVAGAATDSGNPVKVGGIFLTSPPTYTNGQRTDLQADSRGSIKMSIMGPASTNAVAVNTTADTLANTIALNTNGFELIWNGTSWDKYRIGPYQTGQTPILGVGTGTTGAVTGTLAAAASKTTFICGFDISATGGVASLGPITVTGLSGGTFTYQLFSTATGVNLQKTFNPCYPASAVNTAIVVTTTADGTATAVDVNVHGFQQ